MSQTTTQPKPKPKLAECNICRRAGFPEQMITFVNSGQRKPDGKIKWDLLNEDYSIHIHRSPAERFPQLEQSEKIVNGYPDLIGTGKPSPRPDLSPPVADHTLILALTQLSDSLKLLAMSNVAKTNEQKEEVWKKCLQ